MLTCQFENTLWPNHAPQYAATLYVTGTLTFRMSFVFLKFQGELHCTEISPVLQRLEAEQQSASWKKALTHDAADFQRHAVVPAQHVRKPILVPCKWQTSYTLLRTLWAKLNMEHLCCGLVTWQAQTAMVVMSSVGFSAYKKKKKSLNLQFKYLKAILKNLLSTRKIVTSSHPHCQNFNPYQMEITICPLDQWLALGSHWFSYYGKDIIWDTW